MGHMTKFCQTVSRAELGLHLYTQTKEESDN